MKCKTPDDCRITESAHCTTDMYFPPTYDGHGKNLNPDGNTTSFTRQCSTCRKQWAVDVQYGKETVSELENMPADTPITTIDIGGTVD